MIHESVWKPIELEKGTENELLPLIEILETAQKKKPREDDEIDWADIDE